MSHIRFIVASILSKWQISIVSSQLFILAHGASSAFLFFISFLIYLIRNRRSILINTGLLSYSPFLTFFWFICALGNIRAPPTSNFFGEILSLLPLLTGIKFLALPLFIIIFLSVAYSMVLFSRTHYGQAEKIIPEDFTAHRINCSSLIVA